MSRIFLGYPPPKIREFIVEHYSPIDMTKVPLHFVAEEAGAKMSFTIRNGTYQTSTDGKNWTDYVSETEITLANVGDKVYFKAKTSNDSCYDEIMCAGSQFSISSGKIAAKGNIQSLLDETLARMVVPASCYFFMFYDCKALTTAPALPATTLAESCYGQMFDGCIALTQAPALPATTLADWCYAYMFQNCSNLTKAPELPATTLASSCYEYMFQDCSALKTASFPNLAKETVASNIVEGQSAFYDAASDIQATCQDGVLIINSTEA